MANKMIGWTGLKNMLFSRRIEQELGFEQDLEMVSNFLLAISYFSKELINCNLESITYFNNYEEDEGLSFRIGRYKNDLVSVVIDEVSTKNDDFMYFEDARPIKLMDLFYKENKEDIDKNVHNIKNFDDKVYEGKFNECFNLLKQRGVRGYKRYYTTLLMIYGVDHESGSPEHFLQKEDGYDVKEYNFLKNKKHSKELVMKLINAISDLQSELTEEESEKSISFLAMKNPQEEKYAIIEYKQKSNQVPGEKDTLGVLLEIEQNKNGHSLTKTIKDTFRLLPKWLNYYT